MSDRQDLGRARIRAAWIFPAPMLAVPAPVAAGRRCRSPPRRLDGPAGRGAVGMFEPIRALGICNAPPGLLAFIAAWNGFRFALSFTLSNEVRTVPLAIAPITGVSQHERPWGATSWPRV